ncbi:MULTISPECIES: hypothetical protein [unclassified Bradyrhizobium]|uniref:hypothetical protein n=1 Tax=unclassified Bradyrhizobium TaxID=2631580 RepID=UPI0020B1EABC|nr:MULTISPECIES: hypothetical protein [unclassified Bradyrhizobium]MCP3380471.1 hypothetical protein [Bradyrhizobium sp. CCGUVB4N]MCP3441336.1 hypothetical protein [Bradyrhizobium sp. CCGUVB14]
MIPALSAVQLQRRRIVGLENFIDISMKTVGGEFRQIDVYCSVTADLKKARRAAAGRAWS